MISLIILILIENGLNLKLKKKFKENLNQEFNSEEENIFKKPILLKGWMKFFTYSPSLNISEKPQKFEYNTQYLRQFYNNDPNKINKEDEFGSIDIPTELHFFFVLTKKTLYALNSRKVN